MDSVCTPEHQRELDGLDQRFDRDLWRKLIDAGILSSASASSLGGDGFGALEQIAILVALGRQLAAVPYLESVALGAGALARFGSEELQQSWGAPAVKGEKTLSVALDGEMGDGPVQAAGAGAGAGYRLTGTRTQVGFGPVADAFLVPAETDSGTAVFLVDADAPGVTVTALETTGLGSVGHLALDGTEVDDSRKVGGAEVVTWLSTLSALGRSAFQLGVLERGLQMTAEYAREREQFDRPDRQLPGGIAAPGRRLHRRQGIAAHAHPGGLAGIGRHSGRNRRRQCGVLGGRRRSPGGAHHRARARRRRRRHRSSRRTATSWPPRRPSSPWAVPPDSCAGSAGSWPRRPLRRNGSHR